MESRPDQEHEWMSTNVGRGPQEGESETSQDPDHSKDSGMSVVGERHMLITSIKCVPLVLTHVHTGLSINKLSIELYKGKQQHQMPWKKEEGS